MKIDLCLPVYNEAAILPTSVGQLWHFCHEQLSDELIDWQIIILVNGSSDDSFALAQELAAAQPRLKVFDYPNGGKGGALIDYGLVSPADILVYMDIDLAASLEQLPQLIKAVDSGNCDLALGSRLLPESKTQRSWQRELTSRTYNHLASFLLQHRLSDRQCGFKAIKVERFRELIPYLENRTWFFDTELLAFTNYLGYAITEFPIDWSENRYDQRRSKIKLRQDSWRFFKNLWQLKKRLKKMTKASSSPLV